MQYRAKFVVLAMLVLVMAWSVTSANEIVNPGLEIQEPAFWTASTDAGNCVWDHETAYMGEYSLKLAKMPMHDGCNWTSVNQVDLYWNSMDAVLYTIGAYMKTESVNTSPSGDAEKCGVVYYFKDANGDDIVDPVYIDVDQSTETTDWTEYSTEILLPSVPAECYAVAYMGDDASGSIWFDSFMLGSDPWTAGFFGDGVETPVGWMNWFSADDVGYAMVSDEEAYEGEYSVKLVEEDELTDEMVFYSEPVEATANSWYFVSVMVKYRGMNTSDLYFATETIPENIQDRGNLCFFFHTGDIASSWNLTGGDKFLYFDQREEMSDGWVMLYTVVQAPEDASGFSMRARFNPAVTGTCYYDNFTFTEVTYGDNVMENGNLDTYEPFFWNVETEGGTMTWADDQAQNGSRSLKIAKTGTGTPAVWRSDNQATQFWNNMDAVLYTIGGWAKTEGVNTAPANDDEKIGFLFVFEDGSGNDIVDPVFIEVDQTSGTTDWTEYSTEVLLPSVPVNVYCDAMMGSNATGTVWFDHFLLGSDPWTAGFFGDGVETPVGWMNWASTDEVGVADLFNVGEDAYSGEYVAKLIEEDDNGDEMVFYSVPFGVGRGHWYEFSAMIKTVDISPLDDTMWPTAKITDGISNRANICFFWHINDLDNSWDLTGGDQFAYIQQREATQDWTKYAVLYWAGDDVMGASIRARFNNLVQGEVWYDDFCIRQVNVPDVAVEDGPWAVGQSTIPDRFELGQNFPNPFNSSTKIAYMLPQAGHVTLEVYNLLGQRVAVVFDGFQPAGMQTISMDASQLGNMATGMYFYRLATPAGAAVKKMTYIK